MSSHVLTPRENKQQPAAPKQLLQQDNSLPIFQLQDNREETIAQRKLQEAMQNGPQNAQNIQLQALADPYSSAQAQPIQKKENNTGLPDNLKSGIENLSGLSMADVKVHYNSSKPAQMQAHAYAQGTNIHVAPGQEKHLPHEAWHVVQQKQGRVKPTLQLMERVNINDDKSLEREADVMGAKANSSSNSSTTEHRKRQPMRQLRPIRQEALQRITISGSNAVIQRNLSDADMEAWVAEMQACAMALETIIRQSIGGLQATISARESFVEKARGTVHDTVSKGMQGENPVDELKGKVKGAVIDKAKQVAKDTLLEQGLPSLSAPALSAPSSGGGSGSPQVASSGQTGSIRGFFSSLTGSRNNDMPSLSNVPPGRERASSAEGGQRIPSPPSVDHHEEMQLPAPPAMSLPSSSTGSSGASTVAEGAGRLALLAGGAKAWLHGTTSAVSRKAGEVAGTVAGSLHDLKTRLVDGINSFREGAKDKVEQLQNDTLYPAMAAPVRLNPSVQQAQKISKMVQSIDIHAEKAKAIMEQAPGTHEERIEQLLQLQKVLQDLTEDAKIFGVVSTSKKKGARVVSHATQSVLNTIKEARERITEQMTELYEEALQEAGKTAIKEGMK